MDSVKDEMSNLERLVKMLAAQFGQNSEIVLHDLRKDYDKTIVAIENNSITGRKVGDGGTNLGLEVLRNPPSAGGDLYNYINKTPEGKFLRSSTLYFRDEAGNAIGSLCINTDITQLLQMQGVLGELTMMPQSPEVEEIFTSNVEDLSDYFLEQGKQLINKPISEMTKDDKMEIVRFLDSKGFFLITHSGDAACRFLDISKFTLYKYLGIAREENKERDKSST